MNKILSQAIKKAVSEFSPTLTKQNKSDLFSKRFSACGGENSETAFLMA